MFKVMIVDDESKIRTGLSKFIDWKSLDCDVVDVATNGDEAIQKVTNERPHIILTDIRMPKINGIELAKYIYENEPSIQVIILTGYADFEYSRKAIQYDIVDFVLKPTSPDSIALAVNKAKKRLLENRSLISKINTLEHELQNTNEKMIDLILHKIINHIPVNEEEMNTYLKPSLFQEKNNFRCLLIEIDYKNTKKAVEEYYLQNIKQYIHEIFNNVPHYIVVEDHYNICILLVNNSENELYDLEETIVHGTELIETIKVILGFELKIGISLFHKGMNTIFKAYEEANKALRNSFYFGSKPIYIYCTNFEESGNELSLDTIQANLMAIVSLLDANDYEKIIITIESTFNLLKNKRLDRQTIRSYSLLLYSYLLEKNLSKESIETINVNFTKLNQAQNVDDLKTLITRFYQKAIDLKAMNYDNYLVNMVNNYIAKNYSDNISLSSISKSLSVNNSYLSRLYKQITNQNLTTYITKFRIEKAIELLRTTDMKIYKIANAVGIEDATYFSQLFKKYTKHNPSDYR